MRRLRAGPIALAAVVLVGCSSGNDAASGDGTTGPADDAGDGGDDGGATYGDPPGCTDSDDCGTGSYCVAPYDPGEPHDGIDPDAAACVPDCVPENDLDRACIDDDACCGDLRCNEVGGLCAPPVDDPTGGTATGSGATSGTSTASGSTSDTGTADGGSTNTGGSSDGTGPTPTTSSTP